jgi:branched-chain amino acid:cation transporter, LIVCS family
MKLQTLIFYGFSIFSMFFGSGNLVFPLAIGVESAGSWVFGFIGLFCTAVILPCLGLFVIKLYHGNYEEFFGQAGSLAKIALPLFTLSLLGSFGVVPRCITVSYGSFAYIFPNISLVLFSLIFCIICFFLSLNTGLMLKILGKILTPILLIFLCILIICGIINAPSITNNLEQISSLKNGFFTGYETMDLFAAFFFSALIFKQIQQEVRGDGAQVMQLAIKSSIIGAVLLSAIYLGFVFLGAHYSVYLQNIAPQLLLPTIANHILGEHAAIMICCIVTLSCLTTAVALSNIYAHYIFTNFNIYCKNLKNCHPELGSGSKHPINEILNQVQDDNNPKRNFYLVAFSIMIIAFGISLTDFTNITDFLAPLLEISYPGLIALTILSIATKNYRSLKIFIFYFITAIMLCNKFV